MLDFNNSFNLSDIRYCIFVSVDYSSDTCVDVSAIAGWLQIE